MSRAPTFHYLCETPWRRTSQSKKRKKSAALIHSMWELRIRVYLTLALCDCSNWPSLHLNRSSPQSKQPRCSRADDQVEKLEQEERLEIVLEFAEIQKHAQYKLREKKSNYQLCSLSQWTAWLILLLYCGCIRILCPASLTGFCNQTRRSRVPIKQVPSSYLLTL